MENSVFLNKISVSYYCFVPCIDNLSSAEFVWRLNQSVTVLACSKMSFWNLAVCVITGLVHPEPGRYNAEYWEHYCGTWIYIPAACTHGQGARGDHSEVRKMETKINGVGCLGLNEKMRCNEEKLDICHVWLTNQGLYCQICMVFVCS